MGMLLTGKLFSAQEALAMGLVNKVADDEPVMATAERWAAEILECGPLAVQAAKQVVLHTIESPILSGAVPTGGPDGRAPPAAVGGLRRGAAGIRRKTQTTMEGKMRLIDEEKLFRYAFIE